MFCYDQETITIRDKSFKLDAIKDVEEEKQYSQQCIRNQDSCPYVLNAAGGERIYIPTFYVIAKKDYPIILHTPKEIVSDRTKR